MGYDDDTAGRIEQAIRDGAATLDLFGTETTELPDSIGNLTALTSLNLSGTGLTALPDSIGNLTALTNLDLSGTELTALPDWIGNLTALTNLDLFRAGLTALPDSIGNLTALTNLDLTGTGLTALPDSIGNLTALTNLDLSSTGLTALPDWIGNLTALTSLYLQETALTALPDSIGNLTALTTLFLQETALTVLPDSIGNLTALTDLDLSDTIALTVLPDSIGNLTALTGLYLQETALTVLPDSIGNLTALTGLFLFGTVLTVLPDSIGNLTALTDLSLSGTGLTVVPDWIGNLTALTGLHLSNNGLTVLPEWIGKLSALTRLSLSATGLTALPDSIGNLSALTDLSLSGTAVTALPDSIGNLNALANLDLSGNRMVCPPPEVCASGTSAVLGFLRALRAGASEQWTSKMLVVGEATVGKTSVFNALCGRPYDRSEGQTHGVHVDRLTLPGSGAGPDMELAAWDFGGQLQYRATQRFYFTDRSLFLLIWNRRYGGQKGEVEAWLETIALRAPGSLVVVAGTRCKDSGPDLDEQDLRRRFAQIADFAMVDCSDGTGIEQLRQILAMAAARLPMMGARWPNTWSAAADALAAEPGRYIDADRMNAVFSQTGVVEPAEQRALSAAMHDRGQILHFAGDPELRETVVLQPSWLDGMVTKVLDSNGVSQRGGVLSRTHRDELWRELREPGLRELLMVMMERVDLAYRVDSPNHTDACLVVERLPAGRPTLPMDWEQALDRSGAAELSVGYRLPSRQAGVPSWFIAREHRYTTGTHWARGVLLHNRNPAAPAWALLEDDGTDRPSLRLTVRGVDPAAFRSTLDEAFRNILADRYPAMIEDNLLTVLLYCPGGHDQPGEACRGEFEYATAVRAVGMTPPVQLQCPKSLRMVDPGALLYGLRPRPLEEIAASTGRIENSLVEIQDAIRDLLRYRDEPQDSCPSIFTVTKGKRGKYRLALMCEDPNGPHLLPDGAGVYNLAELPGWLHRYAPFLRMLLTALKHALPVAGPLLAGVLDAPLGARTKADVELSIKLLDDIPRIQDSSGLRRVEIQGTLSRADVNFSELRKALYDIDPDWGGLKARELPETREVVYLCHQHRRALHYPAQPPDEADPL